MPDENDLVQDAGGDDFAVGIEPVGPLNIPLPVMSQQPGAPDAEVDGEPAPEPDGGLEDPLDAAEESIEDYNEYLDRAIEQEDCSFCQSVLMDLKHRPLEKQKRGVRELKQLKDAMSGDEIPGKEELREMMADFEVVQLPEFQ